MMVLEEIKKIDSSPKKLREFAFVVGGVLFTIGALLVWRGREHYLWFFLPGSLLAGAGVFVPSFLKPLQKAWMTVAILMGWGMTRVLFSALFCLAILPIGFILRLMGKDLLGLKRAPSQRSYWNRREKGACLPKDYEKQF